MIPWSSGFENGKRELYRSLEICCAQEVPHDHIPAFPIQGKDLVWRWNGRVGLDPNLKLAGAPNSLFVVDAILKDKEICHWSLQEIDNCPRKVKSPINLFGLISDVFI